jgi:hypothetical protein
MTATGTSDRLATIVGEIDQRLASEGIAARSMIHAGSLEEIDAISGAFEDSSTKLFHVRHLEDRDRLEPIPVPRIPSMDSAFRYFVDGAQKTFPVWRFGTVPIIVSVTAAGVLERGPGEVGNLLPGSLESRTTWLVPSAPRHPEIERLIDILLDYGQSIRDPIDFRVRRTGADYETVLGNYLEIARSAYQLSNDIRGTMERDAVDDFVAATTGDLRFPDGWLLIDGRFHGRSERAVGLIKDLATQFVHGEDILTLFDLDQGLRTSAARFTTGDDTDDERTRESNTNWYMRLWSARGQDARHSLVRIEAPHAIERTHQIDEIASWLYAERLPRATGDPRWPTLLYPIHILERILKRRLAAMTTGWPA